MPSFSVRWSTFTQSCSAASWSASCAGAVGRAVVDDEHAEAVGRGVSRAPRRRPRRSPRTFSASLYVGSISQGSPDIGRRTLERRVRARRGRRRRAAGPYLVAWPGQLSNAAIADAFDELGDLYELDGAIVHRVLAYRSAAKAVRERLRVGRRARPRGPRDASCRGSARRFRRRSSRCSTPARSLRRRSCARSSRPG